LKNQLGIYEREKKMRTKLRIKTTIYCCIFILLSVDVIGQSQWKSLMEKFEQQMDSRQYSEADVTARESVTQAKKEFGDKSAYYAQSLSKVGEANYLGGKFKIAIDFYQQSLKSYSLIEGDYRQQTAKINNNISSCYQQMGNYPTAGDYLTRSIALKKELGQTGEASYAKSLNNLGQLYIEQGKYHEAEPVLIEALDIKTRTEGKESISYATSLLNIGILYKNLSNYKRAETYLAEALRLMEAKLGENDPETDKARTNLASVYLSLDKAELAKPLLEKSGKIQNSAKGSSSAEFFSSKFNLASLYWTTGNTTESKTLFAETLEMIDKKFGNGFPLYAGCLNSLGIISWVEGDLPKAENYLRQALELRKMTLGENHPDYATTLHNLAGLLKDEGKFEQAEKYYKQAFNLYLEQIHEYFPHLSESEQAKFYTQMKERFDMFNCYVISKEGDKSTLLGDMFNFQMATKAILLNSQKSIRNSILSSKDSSLISSFDTWKSLRERYSKLSSLTKTDIQERKENISRLQDSINSIEKELASRSDKFSEVQTKKPLKWQDVQKQLKPDEAAVEIIRFRFFQREWKDDIFYAALILTSETKISPQLVLIKYGKELEEKYIKNYTKSISMRIKDNESFNYFWKDIDKLTSSKKNIYLSPDGIYNKININSLLKPDGTYMIENQYVRLVSNSEDIMNFGKQGQSKIKSKEAILIGSPTFNMSLKDINPSMVEVLPPGSKENLGVNPRIQIESLPGTQIEIASIAEKLESKHWKVTSLTNEKATENNLKNMNNPYLLHIATHGYFLKDIDIQFRKRAFGMDIQTASDNPLMRSGLLFAGASDALSDNKVFGGDYENGVLYAYEAMNLNIDNSELVVLSACETGLGEIQNGEGVYGLQRAFLAAGVKNIIMSLWKIDDIASQELMTKFYDEYLESGNIASAFRNAQRKMMEKYKHPYFWAAFIMLGGN
jgi:CHAT domain-containing protein/Tfp pilus assembly protein PilF